jgi:malate dehydrogenase (oxaloacetate-decarboxylating)(NADP+)
MKRACVRAIAELARREASDLGSAYSGETPSFGPDYLIPRPFDPRLLISLAPAVAEAAMASGVAARPMADIAAYRERLSQFVYRTGLLMKPMFDRARGDLKRVVFAEGEEETVLRAVQTVVDEGLAKPILIGRPSVIETRIKRLGLRLRPGVDFELTNPDDDPRFHDYWQQYHQIMKRRGVSPPAAKAIVRSRSTVIASLMVKRGEADALLCGIVGKYQGKLKHVIDVIGLDPNAKALSAMSVVITPKGPFFFTDTHVQVDPTAEQIAESALQAAFRMRLFGIVPKVALISHSNFGSMDSPSARKLARALEIIVERNPKLEADGEMHADAALDPEIRERIFPDSRLTGSANLLVFPNLDAANSAYNLVRTMTDGIGIGPVLMGMAKPAHVLTPSATVRRVVNMTAIAAVEAQIRASRA